MTEADRVFAQILRHNGLVDEAALAPAISEYESAAASPGEGEPALATHLVRTGVITEQVKQAIEGALAKQRAARRVPEESSDLSASGIRSAADDVSEEAVDAQGGGTQRERQKTRRLRVADRQKLPPASSPFELDKGEELLDFASLDVDRFIRQFVPTRSHQQVLQCCIEYELGTFTEEEVGRLSRVPRKEVRDICEGWAKALILRSTAKHTYTFRPSARVKLEILAFLTAWKDPDKQRELRRAIIEVEKKHGRAY